MSQFIQTTWSFHSDVPVWMTVFPTPGFVGIHIFRNLNFFHAKKSWREIRTTFPLRPKLRSECLSIWACRPRHFDVFILVDFGAGFHQFFAEQNGGVEKSTNGCRYRKKCLKNRSFVKGMQVVVVYLLCSRAIPIYIIKLAKNGSVKVKLSKL